MSVRDDSRFLENTRLAFVIYCDENDLDADEAMTLAVDLSDDLELEAATRELPA